MGDEQQVLGPPATTTDEQDRYTAAQRRINMTWEITQALIAVSITGATILSGVQGTTSDTLQNGFFLIIGFYFGRTNHTRAGGIGGRAPGSDTP